MSDRHRQRVSIPLVIPPVITGITITGGNPRERPDHIWELEYNAAGQCTIAAAISASRMLVRTRWVHGHPAQVVAQDRLDFTLPLSTVDAPDAARTYTFQIMSGDTVLRESSVRIRRVPILNGVALSGRCLVDEGHDTFRAYPLNAMGSHGAVITITATTTPNSAEAWRHLAWQNAGIATAAGNVRTIALDGRGAYDVQARIGTAAAMTRTLRVCSARPQDNTLGLRMERIVFDGGRPVVRDDPGHVQQPFDREWQRGRGADRNAQSPQWYAGNDPVTIARAAISVATPPRADQQVDIRATAFFPRPRNRQGHIAWTAWPASRVRATDREIVLPRLNSTRLPREVVCGDPFDILWEANVAGAGWVCFGMTSHIFYVTLADRRAEYVTGGFYDRGQRRWRTVTRPTVGFYTLLAISCRAADGIGNPDEVVAGIYGPFTRLDARTGANNEFVRKLHPNPPLAYWNPFQPSSFDMWVVFAGQNSSARCGAWSEMFVAMGALHGRELQVCSAVVDRTRVVSAEGFLVRNWQFFTPPAQSGTAYTHHGAPVMSGAAIPGERAGLVGQNSPNPPPVFGDHAVVLDPAPAAHGRIYDPSYGGFYADKRTWFYASIGGLYSVPLIRTDPNCGYSTTAAAPSQPNIISLTNQVTGQLVV